MSHKTKTTAATEEATPALVPKLRFPEFCAMKGWGIEEVGDLLDESRKPSLLNDPSRRITVRLHLQGVEHREHRGTESTESTNNFCRKAGQFIYGKQNIHKGAFGIIPVQLDGFETSQDLPCFDFKRRCSPQWFYYNFASEAVYGPLELKMTGTGSKRLNEKTFLSLPIAVPPYSEQQKIAECLSSVDELMAAQARKVDALKTHKKGLMQQLFPREGETQPRLRFPEFQNAGVWEVKRVDEQGSVLAGKALAVNAPGPQRPYLRTKNVLDGAIDLSDVLTMPMTNAEFIRFEILDGDVLLNEGQSLELVGRASMYNREFGQRCAMQNALLRFRAFPSTSAEFASQYFRQCQKDGTFANVATKTTSVAHLGSSRFSALELAWPSPAEQQRIATCLSSLDALITAETQKHEALKTHKKGLMQQLFPSPEEVEA